MIKSDIIPIDAIYILDPSGIPLIARYYQGELDNTDTTLLGGFFSALEIFVKTSLDGLLTDIGLTDRRFYFDRTDNQYIVIIIVGARGKDVVAQEILDLIYHLQRIINLCSSVVVQTAKENMIDSQLLIENLGTTIDSFLLETNFELIDNELTDNEAYGNLQDEALGTDELEKIKSGLTERS